MTVASPLSQAGPFAGTGSNTVFPFGFQLFKAADVRAVRTRRAGGLFFDTELVSGADFTVSVQADQRNSPGGTVTLAVPLRTDETLTLLRRVEATQNTAIPNQGGFYPEVIEAALDKLTMLVQQLENDLRRALLLSVADTGTSIDGLLAGIKSAEAAIANARQAATQAAAQATDANTQAQAARERAAELLAHITQLLARIAGGPVASVNGKQGPHVVLTDIDLTFSGPPRAALTRDAQARIEKVRFELQGHEGAATLARDAQGRIARVKTAWNGNEITVTLTRDAQGRLSEVARS